MLPYFVHMHALGYICMCLCVSVYLCTQGTYVHTVQINIYVPIYTYIQVPTYICVQHVYVRVYTSMCICESMNVYTHVCAYVYIYVYI